jgi:hypothetical protein
MNVHENIDLRQSDCIGVHSYWSSHGDGALFLASAVHIAGQPVFISISCHGRALYMGMSPNQLFHDQDAHIVHLASISCIRTLYTLSIYSIVLLIHDFTSQFAYTHHARMFHQAYTTSRIQLAVPQLRPSEINFTSSSSCYYPQQAKLNFSGRPRTFYHIASNEQQPTIDTHSLLTATTSHNVKLHPNHFTHRPHTSHLPLHPSTDSNAPSLDVFV